MKHKVNRSEESLLKRREQTKQWQKNHPAENRLYSLKWQKENPEKCNEKNHRHYLKHKKEYSLYAAEYYIENRESILKRNREWKQNNPITKEQRRIYNKQRTVRHKGGGKLTIATIRKVQIENIKKYGKLTCIYCLKPIPLNKDTLEHLTPLSRGGTNEFKNLAIACSNCNRSKNNKTYDEFIIYLGSLIPTIQNPMVAFCSNET